MAKRQYFKAGHVAAMHKGAPEKKWRHPPDCPCGAAQCPARPIYGWPEVVEKSPVEEIFSQQFSKEITQQKLL